MCPTQFINIGSHLLLSVFLKASKVVVVSGCQIFFPSVGTRLCNLQRIEPRSSLEMLRIKIQN